MGAPTSLFGLLGQYKEALRQQNAFQPLEVHVAANQLQRVSLSGNQLCCRLQGGGEICVCVNLEQPDPQTLSIKECDEILRFASAAQCDIEGNTAIFH